MRGMIRGYEVDDLFWPSGIGVDDQVHKYWGNQWLEETKGPEWYLKYKAPWRVIKRHFYGVWEKKDFESKIRNAPLISTEEAFRHCPLRFRKDYFNRELLHKVVEVDGRRYLVQVDEYCGCPYVNRMWSLP